MRTRLVSRHLPARRRRTKGVLRPISILSALALVADSIPAHSASAAATDNSTDTQLWSEIDVAGALHHGFSLTGITIGRFSETQTNPKLTALGLDLGYAKGHWNFTVGYRHEVARHEPGRRSITQLGIAAATYGTKLGRSTLEFRGRVENTLGSTGLWRGRIRAEYRWATEGWGPVSYLFVNDEVFYQASAGEWSRNRARAGLGLRLSPRLNLVVFYQRQDDRLSKISTINALGITMKIRID